MNRVYLCDCMDFMKDKPDNYYDLAIVDPPYGIGKADWDKFENDEIYYNFIINMMKELQRIMKDNASIYFFHNDFKKLSHIQVRIEKETNYILRQFIVWNKKFKGSKTEGYLQGYIESNLNRNYQRFVFQ